MLEVAEVSIRVAEILERRATGRDRRLQYGADGRHEARSAGSRPAAHVHPEVVTVLAEDGIDVSGTAPHRLDDDGMAWADVVVTMGCGDECPFIPGKHYIDWGLEDPAGKPIERVREVRDEIRRRVDALLDELAASEVTP